MHRYKFPSSMSLLRKTLRSFCLSSMLDAPDTLLLASDNDESIGMGAV